MNNGLYEAAFANSPIGMAFADSDGRVLQMNHALEELLQKYENGRFPLHITDLFTPKDRDASVARLALLSRSRGRSSWLARVSTDHRQGVWQIDVSVISGNNPEPVLVVAIHDVTAQKSMERRLKSAKLAAERATETKSAFLANMSHEIRTPIHTITGMTELLADTTLDEEQREYADQVRFSADVLLFLINDILDFSRIEAGKLSIESIRFSPTEVVQDSVEMVCMRAHRKGVETVVHIADHMPREVMGDPGRLRQILVNLTNNAVKFTNAGQIVVRVSIAESRDSQTRLRFEVEDTGVGIPAEKQRLLFQPFSQADSSTTRKFGGSGLGLSISKSLVEMMGGAIGLTSEIDVGSCFWFELSFASAVVADPNRRPLDGCRALLVDDNRASAEAIRDYAHRSGAELVVVPDAESCIEALNDAATGNSPFDIVLVDLELPGMDGWQLASRITDQEAVADTPRVLLSPIGLLAGEAKMKRLHWFQGYAKKPVRESDLIDQMRLALNDVPELLPVDEGVDELEQQAASRPRTIVVAEDHDVNQTLFRTILEKMGHRTILASDGVQAIEAVESNEVDLVFMDVQMPRKNGYQATEAVRAKGFSMPIIAVTANAMKGEREKCVAVGMNDFLGKPFGKSDLARLLDRWLPDRPEDQEQTNDQQVDIADTDRNEKARSYGDAGYDLSEEELGTSLDEVNVAVFDRAAALERFMGKSDIVEKVVVQFIAKQTAALTEIREAAEQDRFDEVRSGAHAIKGGAWSIDAQRLGNVAAFLEASAKLEDRERISHYVDRLETAMNEFQREVADGGVVDKSD